MTDLTPITSGVSQIDIGKQISPSTIAIHADDALNNDKITDVAPALHVSTTFRYTGDLSKLAPFTEAEVAGKVCFPRLSSSKSRANDILIGHGQWPPACILEAYSTK